LFLFPFFGCSELQADPFIRWIQTKQASRAHKDRARGAAAAPAAAAAAAAAPAGAPSRLQIEQWAAESEQQPPWRAAQHGSAVGRAPPLSVTAGGRLARAALLASASAFAPNSAALQPRQPPQPGEQVTVQQQQQEQQQQEGRAPAGGAAQGGRHGRLKAAARSQIDISPW
jgi:hypothetical protein